MFDNYKEVLTSAGAGTGESWFINLKDEMPIKVALVGDYVTGKTKWVGNKKFAAAPDDKEGQFTFAINAWDGSACRKLEQHAGLFRQLGKLHESTAGLGNIWVEIGKDGNKYYAKYAGDIAVSDKEAIAQADQVDLHDKCEWANPF